MVALYIRSVLDVIAACHPVADFNSPVCINFVKPCPEVIQDTIYYE